MIAHQVAQHFERADFPALVDGVKKLAFYPEYLHAFLAGSGGPRRLSRPREPPSPKKVSRFSPTTRMSEPEKRTGDTAEWVS